MTEVKQVPANRHPDLSRDRLKKQLVHIANLAVIAEVVSANHHHARSKIVELRTIVHELRSDRRALRPAQSATIAIKLLEGLYAVRDLIERVKLGELPDSDENDPIDGITEIEPETACAIKFISDFLSDHAIALISTDTMVKEHIRATLMEGEERRDVSEADAILARELQTKFDREATIGRSHSGVVKKERKNSSGASDAVAGEKTDRGILEFVETTNRSEEAASIRKEEKKHAVGPGRQATKKMETPPEIDLDEFAIDPEFDPEIETGE